MKQIADSMMGDSDEEVWPPVEDSLSLGCTPKSFGPRDTLTFQMETPHGGYLTVITPADVYFYFVYPDREPKAPYSMVASEDFKTMSTFKVPADIRLPPRVFGKDSVPEPVFSQPGQYEVHMGENLESDHTAPPYMCRLTFTPR